MDPEGEEKSLTSPTLELSCPNWSTKLVQRTNELKLPRTDAEPPC